jgi:hypothetical protein
MNYQKLKSSKNTLKILGQLNAPVFVHILISSLCEIINLIKPETNESDTVRLANKALKIMKQIKKRRPNWKFQFCLNPSENNKKLRKRVKSNKRFFSKISKLKNFLIINQILSKIKIEKGYEENSHLFEALKNTKKEEQNPKLRWFFYHQIPELPNLGELETEELSTLPINLE